MLSYEQKSNPVLENDSFFSFRLQIQMKKFQKSNVFLVFVILHLEVGTFVWFLFVC